MKHGLENYADSLRGQALALGIALSDDQMALLLRHLTWLLETNRTHNLTAVLEPGDALRLHVVDSVTALPEVLQAPPGPLLDMGTGGGFPGLPLAVLSQREGLLVDSVQKKARVLEEFLQTTNLHVHAEGTRVEELALRQSSRYAVVVARAVAQLNSLIELAAPLLTMRGRLVALKGIPSEEEMAAAGSAAKLCGMALVSERTLVLAEGEARTIVTYEKRSQPKVRLPRRVGLAQKRPLA